MSQSWMKEPVKVIVEEGYFNGRYQVWNKQGNAPTDTQDKPTAKRLEDCYNSCAGLNPATYRKCVEVMRELHARRSRAFIPSDDKWDERFTQALAQAQEPGG